MGNVLWFLYGIYTAKYKELVASLIKATQDENFLVFALCGRTIIETTATLRYYNHKTISVVRDVKDEEGFSPEQLATIVEVLDEHSRGGQFNWGDFFAIPRRDMAAKLIESAKNRKPQKADTESIQNPKSKRSGQTLGEWEKDMPELRLIYAFFCELVHPNLGSNFMVMGVKDCNLQLCGDTVKGVGRSLTIEGIMFLSPILREALSCMADLRCWAEINKPETGAHTLQ